tara:strand:- start:2062 stop:4341 length:2280 start_codon:yes stop_codon:yes gene_type:complete
MKKEALEYHSKGRKGKIEVVASKAVETQRDLSLAYSPGVAEPCRMIAEKEELVYEYTARGNLVAVVSNGSAVLGLGNIGPYASKPVMEGKGILFKNFADIDVFDIELNAKEPEDIVRACEMLEPTFGGINLEDIKAPECFYVEEELKKKLNIPVFHDDQHGTAVISGAAFLNALEVSKKKIEKVKVVFGGAGAASIACASLYLSLGVRKENILMVDSKGVIYEGREAGMNPYKARFAVSTKKRTLEEAMKGADAFIGCSVKGMVSKEMVKSMASKPIVFAMANPDPEISPEEVMEVRDDAIIATGRTDYPNQVNNVLGFPFIFRGALDTMATGINEEMKMAAVHALATLAKEEIPESVSRAYGGQQFRFGKEYLIPKPFDRRALLWVASAVAQAAIDSGVARRKIDIPKYKEHLETLLGSSFQVMRGVKNRVRQTSNESGTPVRLILPEGEHPKILRAAEIIMDQGIAEPILLGDEQLIRQRIEEYSLSKVSEAKIIRPSQNENWESYSQAYFEKRHRKGITLNRARTYMKQPNYFGSMMVEQGHGDAIISGLAHSYPDTLRPGLRVIGSKKGEQLAGIYMVIKKGRIYWFADTTISIEPSVEDLAVIAIQTADFAKNFMLQEPRIAMLSFSNFGSNNHPAADRMRKATERVRELRPDLIIDGEMQADTALVPEISHESFPFNQVPGNANVLIFPDLQSGNIAYKLIQRMGDAAAIGPILIGMKRPFHVLQRGSDVNDIVNIATFAALEVQLAKPKEKK